MSIEAKSQNIFENFSKKYNRFKRNNFDMGQNRPEHPRNVKQIGQRVCYKINFNQFTNIM